MDYDGIFYILDKARGKMSWYAYADKVNVQRSIFYKIKRKEYDPGYKILMRFCLIKPTVQERIDMLKELIACTDHDVFKAFFAE